MSNDHIILDILDFDNCVPFTREANIDHWGPKPIILVFLAVISCTIVYV